MINQVKYFEYKIKTGDTFSNLIFKMFGYSMNDRRYAENKEYLLTINPHIKDPDFIKAGDVLHLDILPSLPKPLVKKQSNSTSTDNSPKINEIHTNNQIKSVTKHVSPQNMENFWALSWLEQNSNYLTIPGGIAMTANENLLSGGNLSLINSVSDNFANYKSGIITKGQYDYRRKVALDKFKQNIGPMEKFLFGKNTTHETIRIARTGGVPATQHITRNANRINRLASLAKGGGIVLTGVGVAASCMQIANSQNSHEKMKSL